MAVEEKKDLTHSKGKQALIEIWSKEIENSSNKEEDWRDEARKYFNIYADQHNNKADSDRYNVFWSNTQTLRPLVFSNLPDPNITRRFLDEDENSRILSEMTERSLQFFLEETDANNQFNKARDDYLIGGRGITRVIFDPEEVIEIDVEVQDEAGEVVIEQREEIDPDTKKVRLEYVEWDNFRVSNENVWNEVRWIAFRHVMTREQLVDQFGAAGKDVPLNFTPKEDQEKDNVEELFKLAEVWEIWDKTNKRVIFLTTGQSGKVLSNEEDPYNLKDFFPIPRPLGVESNPCGLTPIPLYRMYKSQAEELNQVDSRIKGLIKQCKFTGVYATTSEDGDVEGLLNGEDGEFNPLQNVQPGIDIRSTIYTKDIVTIANVIGQLNIQKANILQNIRDITGLSDIVRGTTLASETATAQRLKGDFAISRIQPLQKEMEIYVRNVIRLMTELIVENYSAVELAKITNLGIVDVNLIQRVATEQAQALITEANPQTPEEVAEIQANAQKFIQNSLEKPLNDLKGFAVTPEQLQDIDALMKDDKLRSFSVSIETDSTVRVDQNQEKQERLEYVQAISTFSNNFFPLLQAGIITPTAFNEFLAFINRPFKVGRNLEEQLLSTEEVNPEPEQPSVEEQIAQAENQRKDQELQLKAQEVNIKQQLADVEKAKVRVDIEQFNDKLEFDDVNKEADRRAKTFDELIQARTDRVTTAIRESDLLGG
jgi:ribonucleotide reductase alpha subunit